MQEFRVERYDCDQLDEYFDRIRLPAADRHYSVTNWLGGKMLGWLEIIVKHHLATVPMENMATLRVGHPVMNTDPQDLFHIIVHHPGRGASHVDGNYFFHFLLHSLHFHCHLTGIRRYHKDGLGVMESCVSIVKIPGRMRVLVDVHPGPDGPVGPMAVFHGRKVPQITPSLSKLEKVTVPGPLETSDDYVLSYLAHNDAVWRKVYCLNTLEISIHDIEKGDEDVIRHQPMSWTRLTVEGEMIAGGKGLPTTRLIQDNEVDGWILLKGHGLSRRLGRRVLHCHSKDDPMRENALRILFGAELDDTEKMDIARHQTLMRIMRRNNSTSSSTRRPTHKPRDSLTDNTTTNPTNNQNDQENQG